MESIPVEDGSGRHIGNFEFKSVYEKMRDKFGK